jgi:polyisoprenyl-teichoic acid--peptidoglycan teichoic acid transferase
MYFNFARFFHRSLQLFLLLASISGLLACSALGQVGAPWFVPEPVILSANLDGGPTKTPFQPLPLTPTYIPTLYPTPTSPPPTLTPTPGFVEAETRTWADYPGPTIWPDIEVPGPSGLLAQPKDQVNILLLGSDQRPNTGGFRTDTIILLTLNPTQGTVSMTSFPRDLYVYIPGWTVQRINTAHQFGGFDTTALTFEYNFGVRPDHYVLINLWSFEDAIDSLGGVDVEVAIPLTDHRDDYGQYSVPSGTVHMDGETALWYVRSRYSTSDFDRGRRQQEVILAAFRKLVSLDGLNRAGQLYELYNQSVVTDMGFGEMAEFLPLAASLTNDMSRVHRYYIGPPQVVPWVNFSGAQVLLPIRESILEIMRQALSTP